MGKSRKGNKFNGTLQPVLKAIILQYHLLGEAYECIKYAKMV